MAKQFTVSGFSDEITADIIGQFEGLKKLGVSFFEPRMIGGKNIIDLDDAEVADLKALMEKYGIRASSVGSPLGKIGIDDDFEAHYQKFTRAVDICRALDCRYIRMFSFFVKEEEADSRTEDVIGKLSRMVSYAESKDVILLHENEKGIYGNIARRCKVLFERIVSPCFKAVFDFSNFVECRQDTWQAYELLKPYIAYIHIKDCIAAGGVVPIGHGEGNAKAILTALYQSGFNGYVSLEPHLTGYALPSGKTCGGFVMSFDEGAPRKFAYAHKELISLLAEIEK